MDRIAELVKLHIGEERPWAIGVVRSTSGFRTSGTSTVGVLVNGGYKEVLYADAKVAPPIGSKLLVKPLNHLPTSPWFALPQAGRILKVAPLIVAGFDRTTGRQVILGRRNDNTWVVRGPNPYLTTSNNLLTNIKREVVDGVAYHLLYSYPDWQPGEGGKSDLGTNCFISYDDGASWEPAPIQGVVDAKNTYIDTFHLSTSGTGQNLVNCYLYDGGTSFIMRALNLYRSTPGPIGGPGGILGGGYTYNLPLTGQANRIGGANRRDRISGGNSFFRSWVHGASGLSFTEWIHRQDNPSGQPTLDASVFSPDAGGGSLPWEGLRESNYLASGSVPTTADRGATYYWPGTSEAIYKILIDVPTTGGNGITLNGPTVSLANSAPFPMNLAAFLSTTLFPTSIIPVYLPMFRGDRRLVYMTINLGGRGNNPTGTLGLVDGTESVWGGTPPNVTGLFLPFDGLDDGVAMRQADLFLGSLPGEGSNPSYVDTRLVSMRRYGGATPVLADDSGLLDIDGSSFTCQARTSLSTPTLNDWWRVL